MNKCTLKIVISILILILVSYFYFRNTLQIPGWMYNQSSYSPTRKGFTGVTIKNLIRKKEFYSAMRKDTIKYLEKVYPSALESFKLLGDLELASFYNSLTYYYPSNLPYPPQGWFYNDCTYSKYNIPVSYSNSSENQECDIFTSSNMEKGGPGLAFLDSRSLQRNIYFPNGLSMVNKKGIDYWKFVSGQKITWNYPKDWKKGIKDYSYIEITHTDPKPSNDQQSPGWWWNGVVGSGIFLNLGNTLKALNKLDALYRLLNMFDDNFLKKWYNNTNIYEIIYGIIADCENTKKYCNNNYTDCSKICDVQIEGVLQKSKLPLKSFKEELRRFGYENKIENNLLEVAIEAARMNTDYRLNRVSVNVIMDETLFFLGLNAGYDTIQFVEDPNLNGFYVYEILDLRLPERYIEQALKRNYTFFDENRNYRQEFIDESLNKFIREKIISMRDPLDIYNDEKVLNCNLSMDNLCGNKSFDNFYCKGGLSEEYKCNN